MTEQERFERWKASQMAEGWTYEKLKSVGESQEKHFGWRYAEGSIMAKDWKVWSAAAQAVPEGFIAISRLFDNDVVVAVERKVESQLVASGINEDPFRLDGARIIEDMIQAAQENN